MSFHLVLGGSADVESAAGTAGDWERMTTLARFPCSTETPHGDRPSGQRWLADIRHHVLGLPFATREKPQIAQELLVTLCARLREAEASAG